MTLRLSDPGPAGRLAEAIGSAERLAGALSPAEIPEALGLVERLRVRLDTARISAAIVPQRNAPDQLLKIDEAAERLGVSASWLYRQASELPFVIRHGRALRFSARGIESYIRNRNA